MVNFVEHEAENYLIDTTQTNLGLSMDANIDDKYMY